MGQVTQGVVDAIIENRARFEAFCNALTEEELARPVPDSTWIVRDFIAHLDTLDPMMDGMFRATIAGERFEPRDSSNERGFDVDAFNDAAVAERRSWPLARIFEEAAGHRAALIETLSRMTDEQTESIMHFSGDAKRKAGSIPLKLFLAGWAQHDPIHVADMLKALPERAADPEIRAWVDNPFVAGYQRVMAGTPI